MSRIRFLYPALYSAFAVLSLLSSNLGDVPIVDALRPLLIALTGSLALAGACILLFREGARGSLVAAGILIAFFSYGHVYGLLTQVVIGGVSLGHHRYTIALVGCAWLLWTLWTGRWLLNPSSLDRIVRGGSVLATILPSLAILYYVISTAPWAIPRGSERVGLTIESGASLEAGLPDLYYIVLDGYGRADILDVYYKFDNTAFLDTLTSLGFYVADQSRSNYNQTILSLASSLNMSYVQDLTVSGGDGVRSRAILADRLRHSQLRAFLSQRGYRTVAFETGYAQVDIRDADVFRGPETDPGITYNPLTSGHLTPFESLLLSSTALRTVLDLDVLRQRLEALSASEAQYQLHRMRVRYTLGSLGRVAELPGPSFVFAHIISPHPPFVFDSDGDAVLNRGAFSLADADKFGGSTEEYVAGYRAQLQYVNSLVEQTIREILSKSEFPPIIVLQGDHGPGAHMVWDAPEESILEERMAILSAFYFPDRNYEALYPSISPVNSFRVILTTYFGEELELLPDVSYFSSWDRPLDLLEVKKEVP